MLDILGEGEDNQKQRTEQSTLNLRVKTTRDYKNNVANRVVLL